METKDILQIWKSYDEKLDQALSVNRGYALDVLKLKSQSVLASMKPSKIFTVLVGCLWVGIGGFILGNLLLYAGTQVSLFFLLSALFQLGLTAVAIGIYLYQLILIHHIDVSVPVLKAQKRLAALRSSTLWVTRILFLQLPAWTTFYLSSTTLLSGNLPYILINGGVTLLFTVVAVWLFFNIRYENRDKRWFRFIFEGKEWTPILEAMQFYKEIEAFGGEHGVPSRK